jgi:murein DD-endopeptidase MepM/ murein hydrolase activator NlpD
MKGRLFSRYTALFLAFFLYSYGITVQAETEQIDLIKKRALRDIDVTTKILNQKTQRKIQSYGMMTVLKKQIRLRERVIQGVGAEIESLNIEIDERKLNHSELEKYLIEIRSNLQKLVIEEYKTSKIEKVFGFLLSADGFGDAVTRLKYLKSMNEYRRKEYTLLKKKFLSNQTRLTALEDLRKKKLDLLSFQEMQKLDLIKDREEEKSLISKLSVDEKQLKRKLDKQKDIAKKLEQGLIAAIDDYNTQYQNQANDKNSAIKPNLSSFHLNRFRIPWPVKQGYISQTYGKHKHPTLKRVYTMNTGVNITTTSNEYANVVFPGVVSAILDIPGMGQTVLVKHGKYFTVYANLKDIQVSQGQSVKTGDSLGTISTNLDGINQLHFEVWKGSERQNPELWLKRQ